MIRSYDDHLVDASILIVDDTLANLQLLSAILKEQGYRPRPVPMGGWRCRQPTLILPI